MKPEISNPTMKDVAREAGVALGTVSKVVNGIPVGESYRNRVEDAINKLGYQVNSYAQGLRADKTHTVVFLIPNTTEPFYASLTYHVNLVLLRQGYRMLLCCTDYDSDLEQEYIAMAQQNKVDGIIGLTYNPDLSVHKNTPFVSIDRCMGPGIPCVASDNFAGGQLAAEKLADFGCKNVAFLCKSSSISNEPNKRKAGFENGCLARGLHCEMKIVGDNEPYDTFEQFLADHTPGRKMSLDGIFCVTDGLAYFILKMLRRLGLDIPRDIQLIGYDGIRFFGDADYLCSTIVQPVPDIAELCVRLLLDKTIREKPSLLCLPVTYAYGGTTLEDA